MLLGQVRRLTAQNTQHSIKLRQFTSTDHSRILTHSYRRALILTRTHTDGHLCMWALVHTGTHTYTHSYIRALIHMDTYTDGNLYIQTYKQVLIHTGTQIQGIHIFTHSYTYAKHKQTHIRICARPLKISKVK